MPNKSSAIAALDAPPAYQTVELPGAISLDDGGADEAAVGGLVWTD
jgi:hypothetical protein